MKADAMKQQWELMRGDAKIARNYISEEKGLEAVKFCEDMVTRLYTDDMDYAHEMAIQLTMTKYDFAKSIGLPTGCDSSLMAICRLSSLP